MPPFRPEEKLAGRIGAFTESAILRMSRKARQMRAAGHDVIMLTLGEPDFDTPAHIRRAAAEAMEAGHTHYAPIPGLPELRAAIARKLQRENGLSHEADEIVVTNGAKQAIANAILSLVDPGDEVLLPAPYWVAYEGIIRLAGGVPVPLPSSFEAGYRPSARAIAAALGPRSKLIILNSPGNPSGVVLSATELMAIANVVRAHPSVFVLSDEIYEYIVFDGIKAASIGAIAGMKPRTITVNGFSKGFAMTGWRLGYAAAPLPVAQAMAKLQGAITAGANAFVQRAAIVALDGPREAVEQMRQTYERRRALVMAALARMPLVRAHPPQGAFYVLPDISAVLARARKRGGPADDVAFCDWLLETAHVALTPGSAFGMPGTVRISFATSEERLEAGLERLARALSRLSGEAA
jgi:aspartate aminotransferase